MEYWVKENGIVKKWKDGKNMICRGCYQYSNTPILQYSIGLLLQYSITPFLFAWELADCSEYCDE